MPGNIHALSFLPVRITEVGREHILTENSVDFHSTVFPKLQCIILTRTISYKWRRKWQPSPVFLPGEFHGWRSLVGYGPWGCKESDMTERLTLSLHFQLLQETKPQISVA